MRETSGGTVFARYPRGAALLAMAMILVAPSALAARGDREAAAEPVRSGPVVRNTVDELKQLMDAQQLTELRTTYNGNYGASLLFNANTLTYYVALFQEKNFWRVIKTDAVDNAERVYRTFAQQSEQLAQVYIELTGGRQIGLGLAAFDPAAGAGSSAPFRPWRRVVVAASCTSTAHAHQQLVCCTCRARR